MRRSMWIAHGASFAAVLVLCLLLPKTLSTSTQIIGFPVYANYNVNLPFYVFYLAGLVFPLLGIFIFHGLTKKETVSFTANRNDKQLSLHPFYGVSKILAVGASFSLLGQTNGMVAVIGFSLTYIVLLMILALLFEQRKTLTHLLSILNCFFIPLSLFGLVALSDATGVFEGRSFTFFPWLPLPFALGAMGGIYLVLFKKLSAIKESEEASSSFESHLVFLVTGSIAVLVSELYLPQALQKDWYHLGESLVTGRLLNEGFFPFRDITFVHGLWMDPLRSVLAFNLFGDLRWAREAITTLLIHPVYNLFWYLLLYVLLRKQRILFFILFFTLMAFPQNRFLAQAPCLLVFFYFLKKPSSGLGLLSGALLSLQFIFVPEAAFTIVACGAVSLIAFLYYRAGNKAALTSFIVGGTATLVIWLAYLATNEALSDYIEYFVNFSVDHRFGSGIPGESYKSPRNLVLLLLPVFCFWFVAWRIYFFLRTKTIPPLVEYALWTTTLFSVLYFQKILSRADVTHLEQSFAHSAPMVIILLALSLEKLQTIKSMRILFSLFLFLTVAVHILPQIANVYASVRPKITPQNSFPRARYSNLTKEDKKLIHDLRAFFNFYLTPEDKVLDFTDQPDLFFYQLNRQPPSRYFYTLMAMHPWAQMRVNLDLEKSKPPFVIYQGVNIPHNPMDGVPHYIRHYRISEYIHFRYRPFARLNGYSIFVRQDLKKKLASAATIGLRGTLSTERPWAIAPGCHWEHSLRFVQPSARKKFTHRKEVNTSSSFQLKESSEVQFLELHFDQSVDGLVVIGEKKESQRSMQNISFRTHAQENSIYRVPLTSCPQYFGLKDKRLFLNLPEGSLLKSMTLISGSRAGADFLTNVR